MIECRGLLPFNQSLDLTQLTDPEAMNEPITLKAGPYNNGIFLLAHHKVSWVVCRVILHWGKDY